jgi:hypothetical protein
VTDPDYQAKLDSAAVRVADWLRALIDPDQVVELRALKVQDGTGGGSTWAGTFRGDELADMARWALQLSGNCQGVYYTLNPLHPRRLAAEAPRVRRRAAGETAQDADVLCRRWLLVDVDPVRVAGFEKASTTDAEKAAAWELLLAVREYLAGEGCPAPVVADSGNGYHLLYRLAEPLPVSLPLAESDPIKRALQHLAQRFDLPAGSIDTKVFNPSRIVKFPGTLTCKGEPTADRPHRRAKILETPK